MIRRLVLLATATCSAAGLATAAEAQVDLFSRDTLHGLVDARIVAADGEPSWTRAGFGRTLASGGGGGDVAVRPQLDLGTIAWRPQLGWDVSGYVTAQTQPGQDHSVDVAEAFVAWRPLPIGGVRLSARAGLMWPPFSLEHDGAAWTTTRTLTPSAINTWIAEEVKVAGLEVSASGDVLDSRLSTTVAVFGDNDTSGTLLSYRGWALDDLRTTAFGSLPAPRFTGPTRHPGQDDEARPSLELDGRAGGYAKIELRPPAPVALELSYYANGGNPHILRNGQWGWRTTFADAGLTWKPAPGIEVLAQGLFGRTYFGNHTTRGWYVDVDFASAYLLATRTVGAHRFTARADWFRTQDLSFQAADNNDERGWAATADYAYALTPHLGLWLEAMQVWSNRPSRRDIGFTATQSQTVLQAALRASF